MDPAERAEFNRTVALRKSQITDLYNAAPDKSVLTSEWLSAEMYKLLNPVVVYNPTTSEQEIRPLNEVASSHLARRCFVGNLYKQVKDPNLVGALSGHKEGSRAFARYREIDEDMKRDLVSMLE